MKNFFKKLVCITAVISMLPVYAGFNVHAAVYTWNSSVIYKNYENVSMPFRPADKYVSQQNAPSFTWPYVNDALGYDFKICSDAGLNNVIYSKDMLPSNSHLPDRKLETGVNYYWSVRYHMKDGTSTWSKALRFRIDPDAYVYTAENMDDIMARVPSGHPRVGTRPEKLDELRALKDRDEHTKAVYDKIIKKATEYLTAGKLDEDITEKDITSSGGSSSAVSSIQITQQINARANSMTYQLDACGFAYLLSGDEEMGEWTKRVLLKLAGWDPHGMTDASKEAQANRMIAASSARAYDWIYNLLTTEERTTVLTMLKERTDPMAVNVNDLRKFPYGSFPNTVFMYAGVVAYATCGEIEGYDTLLRDSIELARTSLPNWSYEDGGWSEGTMYWRGQTAAKMFYDLLAAADVTNMYEKAWMKNEYLFTTYVWPAGSYGGYGNESGSAKSEDSPELTSAMKRIAYYDRNPVAKWYAENARGFEEINNEVVYEYISSYLGDLESKSPADMPLSHEFKDIGWVAMTDDLADPDRIQLLFRSSQFGTFSHSLSDQNSFLISAFGEKLAISSGYYDAYGSPHETNFYRESFSKNTITYNNGKGQKKSSFNAKGEILQFVNQLNFDSVTADATAAYDGNLDKFVRNVIYVRPDVFIVVDDLDAKGVQSSSFEWWLNGNSKIICDESVQNTALIEQGEARLKAAVQYPQNVTRTYYDGFITPDGVQYTPERQYATMVPHKRVSFASERCKDTKFVVAMDVYKDGSRAEKNINTEYSPDGKYLTMSFEDGTKVIVNLQSNNGSVTAGDITFTGAAVTYNDYSVMLTNGTYLKVGSDELINSNRAVTAAVGNGQICLSSDDDCIVGVSNTSKYFSVESISGIKDDKGRALSAKVGISAAQSGSKLSFTADKGNYTLLSDGAAVTPAFYTPQNLWIKRGTDGSAEVLWDLTDGCAYDIDINGAVTKNAVPPYRFEVGDADEFIITVTARINGIQRGTRLYYHPNAGDFVSHIIYTAQPDGDKTKVTAKANVRTEENNELTMVSALYSDGALKDVRFDSERRGMLSGSMSYGENEVVKNYVWDVNSGRMAPLTAPAEYGAEENLNLAGIYLDGLPLEGFDISKTSYEPSLSGYSVYPVITAVTQNGTSRVVINTDCNLGITEITVKGEYGGSKTYTLEYQDSADVKPYISNLTTLMTTFESLDSSLREGCTDTTKGKWAPTQYKVQSGYTDGSAGYNDRTYGNIYFDNMSELEGCLYIAPNWSQRGAGSAVVYWQDAYYFGVDTYKNFKYPGFANKSFDLYSFDLNVSANLYLVTYGAKPVFIDDSWEKLNTGDVFTNQISTNVMTYDKVYVKHINVADGEAENVLMKTPATGDINDGLYYLFIKPTI